eukprot:2122799-Rhodomonas_salina.2
MHGNAMRTRRSKKTCVPLGGLALSVYWADLHDQSAKQQPAPYKPVSSATLWSMPCSAMNIAVSSDEVPWNRNSSFTFKSGSMSGRFGWCVSAARVGTWNPFFLNSAICCASTRSRDWNMSHKASASLRCTCAAHEPGLLDARLPLPVVVRPVARPTHVLELGQTRTLKRVASLGLLEEELRSPALRLELADLILCSALLLVAASRELLQALQCLVSLTPFV